MWNHSPDGSYRYVTTLDAFAGNSGSGVFDTFGQLVGILVAGATDFVATSEGCTEVNVCDEDLDRINACQDFLGSSAGNVNGSCLNSDGNQCMGETVTGSNVLASVLVQENGCGEGRPCLNGGTCINGVCDCDPAFVGPDCIQELEESFCNGVLGSGWLQCPFVANGISLDAAVEGAQGIRCGAVINDNTATAGAHFVGDSAPEVFIGFNLTKKTTVFIDTCESSFDTVIHLWNRSVISAYAGTHFSSAGALIRNDDIGTAFGFRCSRGTESGIQIQLDPGSYIIQVEGYSNAKGPFEAHLQCSCDATPCDTPYLSVARNPTAAAPTARGSQTTSPPTAPTQLPTRAPTTRSQGRVADMTFAASETCSSLEVVDKRSCYLACEIVTENSHGATRTLQGGTWSENAFFEFSSCSVRAPTRRILFLSLQSSGHV